MKKNEKLIVLAGIALAVVTLIGVIYLGSKVLQLTDTINELKTMQMSPNIDSEDLEGIQAQMRGIEEVQLKIEDKLDELEKDIEDTSPAETADVEAEEETTVEETTEKETTASETTSSPETTIVPDTQPVTEPIAVPTPETAPVEGEVLPSDNTVSTIEAPVAKTGTYKYVAIGNSICIHPKNDNWWNVVGMAASTADTDYVHRVVSSLKSSHDDVTYDAYNFNTWEYRSSGRSSVLSMIDGLLDPSVDLITLQVSDNVSDTKTFQSDFDNLVKYVKKKAPNSQIVVIDDFWDSGIKHSAKINVSASNGVSFVDLTAIKDKPEYKVGLGTTVYDTEGNPHIVQNLSVSDHPNDAAMKYIADGIIDKIK